MLDRASVSALKNHYTILKEPLPVRFITSEDSQGIATNDNIVIVCSVLKNLGEPILKCKKK